MKQKEYRKTAIYYMKVWMCILKAGFNRSYRYKADVFLRFFRSLFVLGVQLLILNAVFGESDVYVGWSKSEAYLVMGLWNILNYFSWSFFGVNLMYLENKVLDGQFDYILLKPISSSWLSSFCDFFLHNFVTAFSGILLVGYYLFLEWQNLTITNILLGFVGLCIGFVFWYSIFLFFATFTISKPRNGFLAVAKELLGITRYPIDIFGDTFKMIFYTAIPIAFITTVPANIVIGRMDYMYLLISLVISLILLFVAEFFWKKNVKGYTSASS